MTGYTCFSGRRYADSYPDEYPIKRNTQVGPCPRHFAHKSQVGPIVDAVILSGTVLGKTVRKPKGAPPLHRIHRHSQTGVYVKRKPKEARPWIKEEHNKDQGYFLSTPLEVYMGKKTMSPSTFATTGNIVSQEGVYREYICWGTYVA